MKIDLDHVALASFDSSPVLRALVNDLGATVLFGGFNYGFRAMQVDCGDLRIELIEPHNVESNDFLKRFLDASGPGPHHLTFKTDDIRRDLQNLREAGYHAVGVNIDNPYWQEAFLHPKEAGGTVVQIAESDLDPVALTEGVASTLTDGERGPMMWWEDPGPPAESEAVLRRVVVTTDEMRRALSLYCDLLGGSRTSHDEGWVEISWPGGGKIRLEHAAGRSQGIDRLEWTHDGPDTERMVGGTRFVLQPERS